MTEQDRMFMKRAIELAALGIKSNAGGPFGAVVAKNGKIIGEGYNSVTSSNDPTAHAEVIAIRQACRNLASFQLEGCSIYTSCEPCPMCLGAIYWARPQKIFYACTREDAAKIGFDDQFIYDELEKNADKRKIALIELMRDDAIPVFEAWEKKENKTEY